MGRICGICEQATSNEDWCDSCLEQSKRMRAEIQKRKVAKQEKQNSGFKKGDHVVMHTCMEAEEHDGIVWTCSSDEYKLHKNHDYTVVMLEGFSGAFQTQYLQKVHFSYPQEVAK